MSVNPIKLFLFQNPNEIIHLLSYYGYSSFTRTSSEIRCCKPNGTNHTVCSIKLTPTLTSRDFSTAFSGDIFNMIEHHTGKSYFETSQTVMNLTAHTFDVANKTQLFDGLFENKYHYEPPKEELKIYSEDELAMYEQKWSYRFVEDGILPKTQKIFDIRYDDKSHRILIPWRNKNNELVGLMGRLNSDEATDCKYLPIIKFPKNATLFNINNISREYGKTLYIGESEKFAMKLTQWGYKNSVALGGNTISETQFELIKEYDMKNLVLCYDEGLETSIINKNINYLRKKIIFTDINVYIMYDKHNDILPKDSKLSPADLRKEDFETLLKYHTKKIKV